MPSLERMATRYGPTTFTTRELERRIIREFQRHDHRYDSNTPKPKDWARWNASLQHHGGPSRFLDFTYSFFVALFFAIEEYEGAKPAAMWALDHDALNRAAKKIIKHAKPCLAEEMASDPYGKRRRIVTQLSELKRLGVWPINPLALDTRLAVQQGLFVMPLNPNQSFEENLKALQDEEPTGRFVKFVLNMEGNDIKRCLAELQRMNITRLSMFPGIDGLAASLRHRAAIDHVP